MLAKPARDRLRDDINASVGGDEYPDKATFWMPVDHPDINERGYQPEIHWQREDIPDANPPYEQIVMGLDPTGVEVPNQSLAYLLDVDNTGTYATHHGARVYDELNVNIIAKGVDETTTAAGEHEHTAADRAMGIARILSKWFREEFDESESLGPYQPPVRREMIPGRGIVNVSEQLEREGTQLNFGVELHYVDDWFEVFGSATDADVTVTARLA